VRVITQRAELLKIRSCAALRHRTPAPTPLANPRFPGKKIFNPLLQPFVLDAASPAS